LLPVGELPPQPASVANASVAMSFRMGVVQSNCKTNPKWQELLAQRAGIPYRCRFFPRRARWAAVPLTSDSSYSIMLYMRRQRVERTHRVTFRLEPALVDRLRGLPNQTAFVETAIRDALARTCPLCGGRGRLAEGRLVVSDFRAERLPRIDRA